MYHTGKMHQEFKSIVLTPYSQVMWYDARYCMWPYEFL